MRILLALALVSNLAFSAEEVVDIDPINNTIELSNGEVVKLDDV